MEHNHPEHCSMGGYPENTSKNNSHHHIDSQVILTDSISVVPAIPSNDTWYPENNNDEHNDDEHNDDEHNNDEHNDDDQTNQTNQTKELHMISTEDVDQTNTTDMTDTTEELPDVIKSVYLDNKIEQSIPANLINKVYLGNIVRGFILFYYMLPFHISIGWLLSLLLGFVFSIFCAICEGRYLRGQGQNTKEIVRFEFKYQKNYQETYLFTFPNLYPYYESNDHSIPNICAYTYSYLRAILTY